MALFRALIAACLFLTLARLVAAAPTPTLGDLTGISGSATSYLTTTEAFDQCDGSQLLVSMTSYVGYCETTTVGGQVVSIQQQLNSNSTMIWSTYTGSWLGTNCNGAANGPIAAGGLAPLMLFGDKYLPKCHVAEGFASSVKINPAPPSMTGATMRVYFDKGCTQQLMLTYLEPGGKCLSKGGSKESSSTTPFNSTHLQMRSWVNSTSCSGKAVETSRRAAQLLQGIKHHLVLGTRGNVLLSVLDHGGSLWPNPRPDCLHRVVCSLVSGSSGRGSLLLR